MFNVHPPGPRGVPALTLSRAGSKPARPSLLPHCPHWTTLLRRPAPHCRRRPWLRQPAPGPAATREGRRPWLRLRLRRRRRRGGGAPREGRSKDIGPSGWREGARKGWGHWGASASLSRRRPRRIPLDSDSFRLAAILGQISNNNCRFWMLSGLTSFTTSLFTPIGTKA